MEIERHSNLDKIPSFSIIIEWENVLLAEMQRSRKMLQQLATQITEVSHFLSSKPEVIIVFNPEDVEISQLKSIIDEGLAQCLSLIRLDLIPGPNQHYYEIKNFGASKSNNDLIILLDSDVIPENNWLSGLLESFKDPKVSVVGGTSYITPDSFMEKAFASFWFFPLKSNSNDRISENELFLANNVAFRRDIFLSNPFPSMDQFRGQCYALCSELRSKGIKIFVQPKSRVSHPTPNGFRHFMIRALCGGQSHASTLKYKNNNRTGERQNNISFQKIFRKRFSQILQRSRQLGLNPIETVGVFGVAFSYYSLELIGFIISMIWPDLIRKNFSV